MAVALETPAKFAILDPNDRYRKSFNEAVSLEGDALSSKTSGELSRIVARPLLPLMLNE
jgi:hypothetical protein